MEPRVANILKTWYDECTIDPMDPETASIVKLIASQKSIHAHKEASSNRKKSSTSAGFFRLNEDLTAFCSKETILMDKRLNLLLARFNSHLQLKDNKNIPATSRELPPDVIHPEEGEHIIQHLDLMDPIDVQRHEGNKRLLYIYKSISNHCENLNKHSNSQDLLIGDEVPTFRSFLTAIHQLFVSKRPLNPQRCRSVPPVSMRSVTFAGQKQQANSFKLIVNVIRAQGLPFREAESSQGEMKRRISVGSNGIGKVTLCIKHIRSII